MLSGVYVPSQSFGGKHRYAWHIEQAFQFLKEALEYCYTCRSLHRSMGKEGTGRGGNFVEDAPAIMTVELTLLLVV